MRLLEREVPAARSARSRSASTTRGRGGARLSRLLPAVLPTSTCCSPGGGRHRRGDFPLVDDYAIDAADGRREGMRAYPRTPPWNVFSMARHSPFLNMAEARRMTGFSTMRDAFVLFDLREARERYDGITPVRRAVAPHGPHRHRLRRGLQGFRHSFFSDSATVSAAEIVKNFHLFFANPEGLLFRYSRKDFRHDLDAAAPPSLRARRHRRDRLRGCCRSMRSRTASRLGVREASGTSDAARGPGLCHASRRRQSSASSARRRWRSGGLRVVRARAIDAMAGGRSRTRWCVSGAIATACRSARRSRACFTSRSTSISVCHRMEASRDWVARNGAACSAARPHAAARRRARS